MTSETECKDCGCQIDADDRWSMQAPVATADGLLCATCYLGEQPDDVEEVRDDDH